MLTSKATYTENAFLLYTEAAECTDADKKLLAAPYPALYELAFEKNIDCDVSIKFLIEIAKNAVSEISHNSDIEVLRVAPEPKQEALLALVRSVPYTNGWEFVNAIWIKNFWGKISDVFNAEIAN